MKLQQRNNVNNNHRSGDNIPSSRTTDRAGVYYRYNQPPRILRIVLVTWLLSILRHRSTLLTPKVVLAAFYFSPSRNIGRSRVDRPASSIIMPLSSSSDPSNDNQETTSDRATIGTDTIGTTTNNSSDSVKDTTTPNIQRKTWNPFRLAVLRWKLTEPAMTSPLNYGQYRNGGSFHCAYCGHLLFPATAKYNSGTGWPSFWRTAQTDSVAYHREWDGRLECRCANCQSHLGHVFLDGPRPSSIDIPEAVATTPATDPKSSASRNVLPRFCINGLALTYNQTSAAATTTTTTTKSSAPP